METPSIGTKALLKGSWWDDDAQTDEERADRERYWVVEVVREDKNYVGVRTSPGTSAEGEEHSDA